MLRQAIALSLDAAEEKYDPVEVEDLIICIFIDQFRLRLNALSIEVSYAKKRMKMKRWLLQI